MGSDMFHVNWLCNWVVLMVEYVSMSGRVDIAWFCKLCYLLAKIWHISGGLILAMIEGVGIAINRAAAEQFKPGVPLSLSLFSFVSLLP